MSHKAVSFTYTITVPEGVDAATATLNGTPVPATGGESFPITPGEATRSPTASYYDAAAPVVRDVQARINELLTAWKDAVGDREKHKEDTGKVAFGRGKAARMMLAAKKDEESDEDDEDETTDECELDARDTGSCVQRPSRCLRRAQ